jgi:N-methylhydantoinase A
MVDAIRVVSIERGIDPRGYTLVVGGGAGAIHAGMLGRSLGMKTAIVPRYGGVFCSFGMIVSDVRHDYMRVLATNTDHFDFDRANQVIAEMERQAIADLAEEGFSEDAVSIARFADAKYPAQIHELTIPIKSDGKLTQADVDEMSATFHDLHERMFSYSVRDSSVDLFHWRVVAHGATRSPETPQRTPSTELSLGAIKNKRRVFFSDIQDFRDTDIYDGDALQYGMTVSGPAVIEQTNTTVVVFPGQTLEVNKFDDFVIEL